MLSAGDLSQQRLQTDLELSLLAIFQRRGLEPPMESIRSAVATVAQVTKKGEMAPIHSLLFKRMRKALTTRGGAGGPPPLGGDDSTTPAGDNDAASGSESSVVNAPAGSEPMKVAISLPKLNPLTVNAPSTDSGNSEERIAAAASSEQEQVRLFLRNVQNIWPQQRRILINKVPCCSFRIRAGGRSKTIDLLFHFHHGPIGLTL